MSAFVEEVDAAAESKNVSLPPKPTAAPASLHALDLPERTLRTLSKAATFLAAEEAAAAHQSAVVAFADPAAARAVAPVAPAKTLAAPRAAPKALGALKAPSATKAMGALF